MDRQVAGEHAPAMYRLLRGLLWPVVRGVLRPTIEDVDRVPSSGPAILCANHMSAIDPMLVPIIVPRPIVYLAKREYFVGPSRWLFDSLGVVPVVREGGSAAQASLDRATDVLRAGGVLSLFPEGTRSPDGRLYRGKTGPVRLAMRTGAPIVPIGLVGTRAVMPPHTQLPRRGPVVVRFGTPLHIAKGDEAGVRRATDALMQTIRRMTGQSYVDIYAATVDDAADGVGDAHDGQPPSGDPAGGSDRGPDR
ncbi:lysophospholipid acyltransferase family protein [soil metagenome]